MFLNNKRAGLCGIFFDSNYLLGIHLIISNSKPFFIVARRPPTLSLPKILPPKIRKHTNTYILLILSQATWPMAASCAPVPVRSTTMSSSPSRPGCANRVCISCF